MIPTARQTVLVLSTILVLGSAAGSALSSGTSPTASVQQEAQTEMKLFAFVYRPGPQWEEGKGMQEQKLGPHVKFMQRLMDEGRLLVAGPLIEANGGLAIVRAHDGEEATEILADDPAITQGIFTADVNSWFLTFDSGMPLKATGQLE